MYRYEFIQKERAVVGEWAEREGEAAQNQLRYLVAMLVPNLTIAGCGLHTHCPKVDTEMSHTQQHKKTRKYQQKAVPL